MSLQISELQSLSKLSINQNLFEISRGEIKSSILSNSYVDKVDVTKHINGTFELCY